MRLDREVVVTGIGVVSPIGATLEGFWNNLIEGKSGVARITQFDVGPLPVPIGAELKDFDPKLHVKPRKSLKVMSREIQMAFAAANMAVKESAIESMGSELSRDRIGAIFGSPMLYGEILEYTEVYQSCMVNGRFQHNLFGQQFPSKLFPLWMLKYLPNMSACHVAIAHDARGPNNTIVVGEASSLLALIESTQVIQRRMADVMICGGTGSRLSLTPWMYRGDIDLSHRIDDPQAASRPFDRMRDGMVNGEGAAAFILEGRDDAEKRGAPIFARIAGYGRSVDVGETVESRRSAIQASIRQALNCSHVSTSDIGHVNAHGLSTVFSDSAEAKAIRGELGNVPVIGLKSYFGNTGAGGGAIELAASVLSISRSVIPGTLNYEQPDSECPVNVVRSALMRRQQRFALKLSQSGTGQCVSLLIEKVN